MAAGENLPEANTPAEGGGSTGENSSAAGGNLPEANARAGNGTLENRTA